MTTREISADIVHAAAKKALEKLKNDIRESERLEDEERKRREEQKKAAKERLYLKIAKEELNEWFNKPHRKLLRRFGIGQTEISDEQVQRRAEAIKKYDLSAPWHNRIVYDLAYRAYDMRWEIRDIKRQVSKIDSLNKLIAISGKHKGSSKTISISAEDFKRIERFLPE